MAENCSLGKYVYLLKQRRILKLQTQFSSLIVFTTKVIFYKKKKLRYHSKSKIPRHFSPASMGG